MKRRLVAGTFVALAWMVVLVTPVVAHGDHDARPLARNLAVGPYIVSLWQVYPDAGMALTPHLIVMFDDAAPAATKVVISVNSMPMEVRPSATTSGGWETTEGIAEGDEVRVSITDGIQAWDLEPVIVPPPPTSMLPMQELIYVSIFLTSGTAWWLAGRTARAWRRPSVMAS